MYSSIRIMGSCQFLMIDFNPIICTTAGSVNVYVFIKEKNNIVIKQIIMK